MIRYLNYLLTFALCLMFAGTTFAQEDTLAPAAVVTADVPAGAFAAISDDATLSVKAFRDEVAKSIVEQSEKSDKLSRGDKRRIARVMKGGWWNDARREKIIDATVQKMYAEQVVIVSPDGVQAAVDWDGIITFIERLMPLILQLISLFGG